MDEIGVFHGTGKHYRYYTCCCRVSIGYGQKNCPKCGRIVIPPALRYSFTEGEYRRSLDARFEVRYKASGKMQADIVAARLKGQTFVMPKFCERCGEPKDRCDGHWIETDES